jgi:hypothetical protein
VTHRVLTLLDPAWRPKGDGRSRMRDLMDRFAGRLGGGEVEVVPGAEWTARWTLRGALETVRARTWSTIRGHLEDCVAAAADAVERRLVAEVREIDAAVEAREGVRPLVAQLSR